MSVDDGLPPLREVIAAHGLAAKKSLGQNFIFDFNLTRRIARAAGIAGATVYEVGPGPGGLTRALLAEGAARVIAVERDARCIPALAEIGAAKPGRLEIVEADALLADERALLLERRAVLPVPVAANLPFNAGTALLIKWLTAPAWPPWWSSLTLMFQKEVAQRIAAEPGGGAYGRLSVLAAWRTRAKILFDVSPRAFVPPPKVTSAVLRIEPLPAPRFEARLSDLEAVTAAAFGQRRKMLRGSLKTLTPDAETLLAAAGVDGTQRAEELDLARFLRPGKGLRGKAMSAPLYDTIGKGYAQFRRPDPRIAAAILKALGDARTLVNVGAGAGSYEPAGRAVIAVEPSETMIRQRREKAAPVVRASAMDLPFRDNTFDAATALLTIHHWPEPLKGLGEMMRVARRCVVFSWEPSTNLSWLTRDYFPEIRAYDRTIFPLVSEFYGRAFARFEIVPVPVPHDCLDGFLEAYWRRPEAYFDPGARRAISSFSHATDVEGSLAKLRRDLSDGTWSRRNGHLMELNELDLGYRLIIADR